MSFMFPCSKKVYSFTDNFVSLSFIHVCAVTTCCLARDALNMLRERKDGFDIVISDVNMPDMDGFKLLEHVGLEMDLPVISEFTVYFFPFFPRTCLLLFFGLLRRSVL